MGIARAVRLLEQRSGATAVRRRRWVVGGGLAFTLLAGMLTAAPAHAAVQPDPPTNVSAVAGDASATVSWTAPASDGGSPIVEYLIAAQPGQSRQRVAAPATSGVIGGLTNGITYTFTVRAYNAEALESVASAKSNTVTPGGGTGATAPDAPTGVTAVAGDQSATVSWTAPADNGSAITKYRINVKPGSGVYKEVFAPDTSVLFDGLANGVEYTFTVRATNGIDNGPYSAPSNPVTPGGGSTATVPGAPTGVTAVAGDQGATVSWTAPANNGGSPILSYRVNVNPGTGTFRTVDAPASSLFFDGLVNGTEYTFTVIARNSVGGGAASSPSNAVTPTGSTATVPGAPTNVTATAGDAKATVSWAAPANNGGTPITGYRVDANPGTESRTASAGATSLSFTPLANGTPVSFTVTALNSQGESLPSTETVPVTPTAQAPATSGYSAATTPQRVLDTRNGTGATMGKIGAGQVVTIDVPGLPADATAVALNITATSASTSTFLVAYEAGTSRPNPYSNVNIKAGQTVANLAVVGVGSRGRVAIYNRYGTVDVIADLVGYYSPTATSGHSATTPKRVLDTRNGTGLARIAKVGASQTVTIALPGLPANATSAILNVTATNASTSTYLVAYPAGTTRPNPYSNVNLKAGETVANLAVTRLGGGAQVTIYNAYGTVDVIADLVGYYSPTSTSRHTTSTPTRVLDTRMGTGAPIGKVGSGQTITLTIPGLPANVTAVTLNLTATGASTSTYLVVHATGTARPNPFSNVNLKAGQTVANLAVSKVGPGGKVSIYNSAGTVDVIADLVGYYSP